MEPRPAPEGAPPPAAAESPMTNSGVPASAPPPDDAGNRLRAAEARIEGLDESLAATRTVTDRMTRLKLSGYIQGRYEWQADSGEGLDEDDHPANENRFLVRRGRFRAIYDATNAEFVLKIDGSSDGVALVEAEATLVDTWTPFGLRLTVGQFKWPFGFELLQSSADREMPERSRMVRRLFPGEHDRGLRLQARYGPWRAALALVNGTGADDNTYHEYDQNGFKDLVGRVGLQFETLSVGVSGYWGRWLDTKEAKKAVVDGTDTNGDGVISGDEIQIVAPATPAQYWSFARLRVGADAALTVDIPDLGDLVLRAEVIWGKDTSRSFRGVPADPCLSTTALGWMATAVQNIGPFVGLAVRLDSFDPSLSGALPDTCLVSAQGPKLGTNDRVITLGGGLLLYTMRKVKISFVYEHLFEEGESVDNDAFTAQLQVGF